MTKKRQWGTSGDITVSTLDKQIFTRKYDSHWVPHSYGHVSHMSKTLSNFSITKKQSSHEKFESNNDDKIFAKTVDSY